MASAKIGTSAVTGPATRFGRGVRTRSYEALHSLSLVGQNSQNASSASETLTVAAPPHPTSKQQPLSNILPKTDGKSRPISRLELLLASKTHKAVFIPEEDTSESQAVNLAIKMSSQWTDVRDAILDAPFLSSSNLAYTLYRLGCLAAFDSKKRRNDLQASNFVPKVFNMAMAKIELMDPASLALILDGCARLQHKPATNDLAKITALVKQHASVLDACQLSLVLWALSTLDYHPGSQTMAALEAAISSKACDLPPQGVALVLSSFHAVQYGLGQATLTRLADVIQRKLLLFKPSELATSLKNLSAFGFHPSHAFIQALQQVTGKSYDAPTEGAPTVSAGMNLSMAC